MAGSVSGRAALPGLVAGALGLAAGMIGLALDLPGLGAVAGLLALAAGVANVRLARLLEEQGAVQELVEEELRSVRAESGSRSDRATDRSGETHQIGRDPGREPGRDPGGDPRGDRAAEAPGPEPDEATTAAGLTRPPGDHLDGADLDRPDPLRQRDQLLDPSTGLFSQNFFMIALDSRIAAARRHLRPVSVVLLDVVEGLPSSDPRPTEATAVAEAINTTLREADTACRLEDGNFALLLEDTPENGAIWTVERIRRFLSDKEPELTMWAGVACYPAHAFGATEIMSAADGALESAREWRQDRIEVALVASD